MELRPSANSNAYREYLLKLATTCTEEDEDHVEQIEQAALRCDTLPLCSLEILCTLGCEASHEEVCMYKECLSF